MFHVRRFSRWLLMRELKYKTYDVKTKKVIFIDLLSELGPIQFAGLKESYVLQYTGLKDKHGKEIYEGDILDGGEFLGENVFVYWNEEELQWYVKRPDWKRNPPGMPLRSPFADKSVVWKVISTIYQDPGLID